MKVLEVLGGRSCGCLCVCARDRVCHKISPLMRSTWGGLQAGAGKIIGMMIAVNEAATLVSLTMAAAEAPAGPHHAPLAQTAVLLGVMAEAGPETCWAP